MGEVYLAWDERLGRKIALKLLPEELTADETQVSRFKTEARAASALNHPNILTVYEISSEGDRQSIATEFIEGVTLRAWLSRGKTACSEHDWAWLRARRCEAPRAICLRNKRAARQRMRARIFGAWAL